MPSSTPTPKFLHSYGLQVLAVLVIAAVLVSGIALLVTSSSKNVFVPGKTQHIKSAKYITIPGPNGPIAVYKNVRDITIKEGLDQESTNSHISTRVETTFYTAKGLLFKSTGNAPPLISSKPPISGEKLLSEATGKSQSSTAKAEQLRREAKALEAYQRRQSEAR